MLESAAKCSDFHILGVQGVSLLAVEEVLEGEGGGALGDMGPP